MSRERLLGLRNAIDRLLELPASSLAVLLALLTPSPGSKLNGAGPPAPSSPKAKPKAAKPTAKRGSRPGSIKPTPAESRAAEDEVLAQMRLNPGMGALRLAKLMNLKPNTVSDRMRRLGKRGLIERAADGKTWRIVEDASARPSRPARTPALSTSISPT